jgi:ribokinase
MAPPFEVLGLGQCALDRLAFLPSWPEPDTKPEVTGLTVQCGGPVATALYSLSHWGRSCSFCGVVGDDPEGRWIRDDLVEAGVDVSHLIERPSSLSQSAFIVVEPSARRTIFWQRPTGGPPGVDELDPPAARVFLTDGLFAEPSVALARMSEAVVVDAGTEREGTRALLDCAKVFVASSTFARAFAGDDDPVGACRKIRERGVEVAGVTLGDRGYVACFGDTLLERPAHKVEAVDTTGCGDLFHAGIVEGMLSGWPWEKTFDFAAWAAACCATRLGGRAGVPAREAYPG